MNVDARKVNLAEKDIEDYLWEHPGEIDVSRWIARQLRVPSGIIDLVGWNLWGPGEDLEIVVVEVKNVEATAAALTQVSRYAYDIENVLSYALTGMATLPQVDAYKMRKVVVAPAMPNRVFEEAEALGIEFHEFAVDFKLTINQLAWTSKFNIARSKRWAEEAQSERWGPFLDVLALHQTHEVDELSIVAEFTEAIRNAVEKSKDAPV